jgi:hypothetical protein
MTGAIARSLRAAMKASASNAELWRKLGDGVRKAA